jgi:hypothetical protein
VAWTASRRGDRVRRRLAIRQLKIAAVAGTILLATIGATVSSSTRTADSDKGCNVRLKGLKTLSDPQGKLVNLHPKDTTLAAINALPQPHPAPKTRSTAFERQVWRINVRVMRSEVTARTRGQRSAMSPGERAVRSTLAARWRDRRRHESATACAGSSQSDCATVMASSRVIAAPAVLSCSHASSPRASTSSRSK